MSVFDHAVRLEEPVFLLGSSCSFTGVTVASEVHEMRLDERVADVLVTQYTHHVQDILHLMIFHRCLEMSESLESYSRDPRVLKSHLLIQINAGGALTTIHGGRSPHLTTRVRTSPYVGFSDGASCLSSPFIMPTVTSVTS
jgi:hypothetical protein